MITEKEWEQIDWAIKSMTSYNVGKFDDGRENICISRYNVLGLLKKYREEGIEEDATH